MRILQITAAYKPAIVYGGPTMSVAMLCEELVRAGIDVTVFTTTANGSEELSVKTGRPVIVDGVNVIYFKRITKDHTHLSLGLLKTLWKNARQFDVIHIHAWWNLVSVLSCMIAIARKVPVIVSPRGTLSPYSFTNKNIGSKKLIHNFLGKALLDKSHIHTTSGRESAAITHLITPKSITILPNFVKLVYSADSVVKESLLPIKLLFFSRIEEKKGLDTLLQALQHLKIPYHLTIAGNGRQEYIEQLKAQALQYGIKDKLTWAGFQDEHKFDLMRAHHLLVLPSHDENFGNVVIESLSVGTAVLVSDNVGLADYVLENSLGWVCKADALAISDTITTINHLPDELERISKVAPTMVRNDFTGNSLTGKYISLYQSL